MKKGKNLRFKTQPSDRPIGKCQKEDMIKQTTRMWYCEWEWDGIKKRLMVPNGYIYDGASVPRIVWSLVGLRPDGLIRAASLAHDALFRAKGGAKDWQGCSLVDGLGMPAQASYDESNWCFMAAMQYANMYRHRSKIAYRAVQTFGRRHWGGPCPSLR